MPVDVFPAEVLQQQAPWRRGDSSIGGPLDQLPRKSVTDAGDIVRPFTLRGLSPDHTLVLVNGWRRHRRRW